MNSEVTDLKVGYLRGENDDDALVTLLFNVII